MIENIIQIYDSDDIDCLVIVTLIMSFYIYETTVND